MLNFCIKATSKILCPCFEKTHLPLKFSESATVATRWQKHDKLNFLKEKFWLLEIAVDLKYWSRTVWVRIKATPLSFFILYEMIFLDIYFTYLKSKHFVDLTNGFWSLTIFLFLLGLISRKQIFFNPGSPFQMEGIYSCLSLLVM